MSELSERKIAQGAKGPWRPMLDQLYEIAAAELFQQSAERERLLRAHLDRLGVDPDVLVEIVRKLQDGGFTVSITRTVDDSVSQQPE